MRGRIENLIETDDTRREKRRIVFTRLQWLCFGVFAACLAGYADPWWKMWQTAIVFLVLGVIVGACKVISCRLPRRTRIVQASVVSIPSRRAKAVAG